MVCGQVDIEICRLKGSLKEEREKDGKGIHVVRKRKRERFRRKEDRNGMRDRRREKEM